MYLLDTNVCIDFLAGRNEVLAQRMFDHIGCMWISSITVGELLVGASRSTDPQHDAERIAVFVANVDIADFDLACAHRYGAVVRTIGVWRKSFDRLIGGQALERGLVLVTRNLRDFADVPGLVIEDWTQ